MPVVGPTAAAPVGDYIYVFSHGKRVYRYSPSSDTYEALVELPMSEWFTFDVTYYGTNLYTSSYTHTTTTTTAKNIIHLS